MSSKKWYVLKTINGKENKIKDYIEDEYMEDEDGPGSMTAGLPSKETLLQQYWESRMTLADY